jgi:hypothetical protein
MNDDDAFRERLVALTPEQIGQLCDADCGRVGRARHFTRDLRPQHGRQGPVRRGGAC